MIDLAGESLTVTALSNQYPIFFKIITPCGIFLDAK